MSRKPHRKTAPPAASRGATQRGTAPRKPGAASPRPGGPDPAHLSRIEGLEKLANRMDSALRIPGTRIRFGFDSVLGLVPGVGDVLTLLPGAYIMLESHRMGVPRSLLVRQGANVAIDTVVGTIPLIGDLFDVGFKSNRRNVAMLRAHVEGAGQPSGSAASDPASGELSGNP